MSDSRPRSGERFSVPLIARYRAWIWKSTVHARVRLVLFLLLYIWLELHKLQCNLSCIFKNIYEVTVFVINWAWLRCEAQSYTFLRNIGATHVTASLARWFDSSIFFNDSSIHQIHSICKIAIFQFPHFLVAKDIQDSLVSKRWKYRMIKSKLFIRIAIKTCWIRRPLND